MKRENVDPAVKHTWVRSSRAGGRGSRGFRLAQIAWVCLQCGQWTANLPKYKNEVCPKKDRRKAKEDRRKACQ